jgi:circadian clock protein KaiB
MIRETDNKNEPGAETTETWELILFLAGNSIPGQQIYGRLERLCETHLSGRYRIEVVDLTETPAMAYDYDIIATPTLVRQHPKPMRKVFGDLSQTAQVLSGLGFPPS